MITQKRLKEVLHYNSKTGIFTWIKTLSNKAKAGNVAGSLANGYVLIMIDTVNYKAHRLAWLYMTGAFPILDIDHKDHVRNNNVWTNLRECNRQSNIRNSKLSKNNSTGFVGVMKIKSTGRFKATITIDRKTIHLGVRATPEEASLLYQERAKKEFGEFYANIN